MTFASPRSRTRWRRPERARKESRGRLCVLSGIKKDDMERIVKGLKKK
jgi:hypothetical protein